MKNSYEFNIEEIDSVIIVSNDDSKYTTLYHRKYIDDKPTESFILTYSANVSRDKNGVKVICERCGSWYYNNTLTSVPCQSCTDDYEDIISEDDLINTIMSFTENESSFFEVIIFINGIHIQ